MVAGSMERDGNGQHTCPYILKLDISFSYQSKFNKLLRQETVIVNESDSQKYDDLFGDLHRNSYIDSDSDHDMDDETSCKAAQDKVVIDTAVNGPAFFEFR